MMKDQVRSELLTSKPNQRLKDVTLDQVKLLSLIMIFYEECKNQSFEVEKSEVLCKDERSNSI